MIRKTLTILPLIGLIGAWCLSYRPHPSSPKAIGAVWGWTFSNNSRDVSMRVQKGILIASYGFLSKPGAKANQVSGRLGDFRFVGGATYVALCVPPGSAPSRVLYEVAAPFWFFFLGFSSYPIFMTVNRALMPHRHRKLGLCVRCGYDLRGSTERCPECGTGIS